jgi:hypothetical protein
MLFLKMKIIDEILTVYLKIKSNNEGMLASSCLVQNELKLNASNAPNYLTGTQYS